MTIQPEMSTQFGFGALLNELAREKTPLAERIVTTSPDVTVSTNLGPWVNRRGLFARESMADTFKSERIPSTFNWEFSPKGQHIELGIAEMNLFILLSALGLSHSINGERLLPIGTLYDPFIARGLDALNYACYQDARFIVVATPSGLTLAPEGGAHQSIAQPLIGMAQDGLAAFEPAFVDELAVILAFALDYIQKDGDGEASERNWLRDETGGSVYLRLSTRPVEQIKRAMTPELRQAIVDGAYWLREPGPELPGRRRLYRRGRARGDPGGRPDGGGPPRRRPARRHLGRPAQRRLDRGAAGARARSCPRPLAHRAAARGLPAQLRHRTRCSTAIRRPWAGSARCSAIGHGRSASSISARPARCPTSIGTTASTPTPSSPRRRPSRPAGRSVISARSDDSRRRQEHSGRHRRRRPGRADAGAVPRPLRRALGGLQRRARGAPASQGLDAQLAHHGASPAARHRAARSAISACRSTGRPM